LSSWKDESPHWKQTAEELKDKLKKDYQQLALGLLKYNQAAGCIARSYFGKLIIQGDGYDVYHYGDERRPPMLCIPSLINQAYIMDLHERSSFMQKASSMGFSAYLIAWHDINLTAAYKDYGIDDYINIVLVPLIQNLAAKHRHPITLVGYCFGGILAALASNKIKNEIIKKLIMLATPWDFSMLPFAHLTKATLTSWQHIFNNYPYIPSFFLQALFYWQDVFFTHHKFQKLGRNEIDLTNFTLIENWVNDGINMSKKLFFDCLEGLIYNNNLVNNKLSLKIPVTSILATHDKLVPVASGTAIQNSLPQAKIITIPGGHLAPVFSGVAHCK
jgi:poly(3-hydroxyalkanoate) synthetase